MNPINLFDPADATWLPHRHFASGDAIRFIAVSRAVRKMIPFLTDNYLPTKLQQCDLSIAESFGFGRKAQVRWLFHSAFCGSTLLAHAFDVEGTSSAISEPVLLNDVVGLRRRGAERSEIARLVDCAVGLLGRTFANEMQMVVKPSNLLNPLAELLIAVQGGTPALFLYSPLPTFLVSVANKGLPCRIWCRELAEGYLRDGFIDLGIHSGDYFRMSDLQVAAVGWLAQHAQFSRLSSKLGPARLRALDADAMLARPQGAIRAVADFWGISLSDDQITSIIDGGQFSRHSKSGEAYSSKRRIERYSAVRAAHADEIDTVLVWATKVAGNAGVSMNLPHMLEF